MSLVMFWVDHDRRSAQVASDTLCWDSNGPIAFASKVLVQPHNLCVIAHRGISQFTMRLQVHLAQTWHGAGLDGLVNVLQLVATKAQRDLERDYPGENYTNAEGRPRLANELWAIGYSPILKGFGAVRLASPDGFEPHLLPTGGHFSGVDVELKPRAEPLSVGEWIKVAEGLKRACAYGKCGGDLVLHRLSSAGGGSITCEKIHRFHDYDATLKEIEARWSPTSTRSEQPATSSERLAAG